MTVALGKTSLLILLARVGMSALQLLLGVLVARTLSTEAHGLYRTVTVFTGLAVLVAMLGLGSAIIFRVRRMSRPMALVRQSAVAISCTTAILFGLACLVLEGFVRTQLFPGLSSLEYLSIVLWVPGLLLAEVYLVSLQAEDKFRSFVVWILVGAGGRICFILLALVLWSYKLGGVLAAMLAWQWVYVALLSFTTRTYTERDSHIDAAEAKACIAYGLRGYPYSLSTQMHRSIDVLMIGVLLGDPATTGFYALAVTIVDRLLLLPEAIGTAWFPSLASMPQEDAAKHVIDGARLAFFGLVGLSGLLALLLNWLVPVLYGSKFVSAIGPAQILLPGIVMFGVSRIMGRFFMAIDKQRINAWCQGLAVLLNIALNLILVPRYGITGAAAATVVSYSAVAIGMITMFYRVSQQNPLQIVTPSKRDLLLFRKVVS